MIMVVAIYIVECPNLKSVVNLDYREWPPSPHYINRLVRISAVMTEQTPQTGKAALQATGSTFRKYAVGLHRYLARRLGNTIDADDLVQEVFLRLLRIENTELVRKPQAYLYGVAFNVVREHRMRSEHEQRRLTFDSDAVDEESEHPKELPPDQLAERLDVRRKLEQALARLTPMHRAVVILLKRDGMSYEEAARMTNLSVHTVEKYFFQAKAQLKTMKWDL
jgi:RNA polymerase sigma factor (sigma-70 family)